MAEDDKLVAIQNSSDEQGESSEKEKSGPATREEYEEAMKKYKKEVQDLSISTVVLYAVTLALMVVATSLHQWVEQGDAEEWSGSLTRCSKCLDAWDDGDSWEEIRSKACRVSETWWQCETMERLENAAINFLICEVFSMMIICFIMTKFFLLALQILNVLWDLMFMILIVIACVLHIFAIALWFSASEAIVDQGACERDDPVEFDEYQDICATGGPIMHMIICLVLPCVSIIAFATLIVKWVRKPVNPLTDDTEDEIDLSD